MLAQRVAMSPTELEARRWRAALDAVRGRNGLRFSVVHSEGTTRVNLYCEHATEETIALWQEIRGFSVIYLTCSTVEWVEMLAQGSK